MPCDDVSLIVLIKYIYKKTANVIARNCIKMTYFVFSLLLVGFVLFISVQMNNSLIIFQLQLAMHLAARHARVKSRLYNDYISNQIHICICIFALAVVESFAVVFLVVVAVVLGAVHLISYKIASTYKHLVSRQLHYQNIAKK